MQDGFEPDRNGTCCGHEAKFTRPCAAFRCACCSFTKLSSGNRSALGCINAAHEKTERGQLSIVELAV